MTAPSGQLEAGGVTVTEEHRLAAISVLANYSFEDSDSREDAEEAVAHAIAAAERRGAEREREACETAAASVSQCSHRGSCLACQAANAIRARKP